MEAPAAANRPMLPSRLATNVLPWMTWAAVACLAAGVFTSVALSAGYHILVIVPGLVCLAWAWRRERWKCLPASAWVLFAIVGWGLLSDFINWGEIQDKLAKPRTTKLKYYFFGILGLVALRHSIQEGVTRRVARFLLHVCFLSIIVSVVCGMVRVWGGFDLVKWEYGNFPRHGGITGPMRFGYGMCLVLPVLLGLWLRRREWDKWYDGRLLAVTLVFGLAGLLLTQTRGALFALLIAVPLAVFLHDRRRGLWIAGGSVCLATVLVVGNLIGAERLSQTLTGNERSIPVRFFKGLKSGDRMSVYTAAVIGIRERPWSGNGMLQFEHRILDIKQRHNLAYPERGASHAHNVFLQSGVDFGVPGLIALVAWFILWGRELCQRRDALGRCFLPLLVAFVLAGQFEYLFDANNSFLIFFAYALSLAIPRVQELPHGTARVSTAA